VGADDHPLGRSDRAAVAGEQGDTPAILGVVAGPVGEDFPWSDGVELFDTSNNRIPMRLVDVAMP